MEAGRRGKWLVTVLVCAALSPVVLGATWQVGSGETDLKTIRAAVDAAASGDTIILSPGVYTGPDNCDIDLQGKALTIQSVNPLDSSIVERTILDCAGSEKEPHRGFYVVDCNGVVLSGLTITHGLALAGGAIYCQNSTLDVTYCRILDNATLAGGDSDLNGGPGGGLYCESSIVQVVGCLISGNKTGSGAPSTAYQAGAGGCGAGLYGVKSDISVVSSTITSNAAGAGGNSDQATAGSGGDGGGVFGNLVRLVNSTVSLNAAGVGGRGVPSGRGGRGGAVCADTAVVDRCIIEANRAGNGGQPVADTKGNGSSGGDGGGIYSSSLGITNSLVTGNRGGQGYAADPNGSVFQGDGGGLWCAAGSARQCTIAGNAVLGGRGAGLFCSPTVKVVNCILYENTPDQLSGQDYRNVVYCNVKSSSGEEMVFENPGFVQSGSWVNAKDSKTPVEPNDPNAVWAQGDYHLKATSSLLDSGDPNYVPSAGETDLGGNNRLADAAIDLGAYESAALVPVYRFWSAATGKHFYTVDEAEKDKLINESASVWTFEGAVYYAYTRASEPNLLPVYEFSSQTLGSYFYTINEAEKDKLINKYAQVWKLEGPAFYAYPTGKQPAGTQPVYRFWSDKLGGHFYTIKEAEKDKLIKQYPNVWAFEGVAWYAYVNSQGGAVEPNAAKYEFTGGSQEALCTIALKAYVDGNEVKIDSPDVAYIPQNAYMRMTVDLKGMTATLEELLVQSTLVPHTMILGNDANGTKIVLTSNVIFWGRTPRGPFGIDPNALTFPTTGSGSLTGSGESFTIGGKVTIDGNDIDIGLVQRATRFMTGGAGAFDTSAEPALSARMAGTFQWSRQQQDLLFEKTVKGHKIQLYVVSDQIQTAGTWQGKKSQ